MSVGARRRYLVRSVALLWGGIYLMMSIPALAQVTSEKEPQRRQIQVHGREVVSAIKAGVGYLLRHEDKTILWEGYWPDPQNTNLRGQPRFPMQYGGETALVTQALLDVGQSLHLPQLNIYSPEMKRAIHFLTGVRPRSTYVASLQANAMALLPPKHQYLQVLQQDEQYLLAAMNRQGGYTYWLLPRFEGFGRNRRLWDNSNTQYGVLGVWACAHCGLEIPPRYWTRAAMHWRTAQTLDGSWGYSRSGRSVHRASAWRAKIFTPAGVASLLICNEYIYQRPLFDPHVDRNVERGLDWIHAHFTGRIKSLYSIYNYVRLGLACGLQTFGGRNWYTTFARNLLSRQYDNGHWKGHFIEADNNISTAYGLLSLDRGLNPILISKLQYNRSYDGLWNVRQRDAANFTSWVSKTFETPLNWQVVNFQTPVSQWLNSPLLLITGHADPRFTPGDIAKLRRYIHDGGIILASCDTRSLLFKRAIIRYALETVHHRYPIKVLSTHSMLYNLQPWYHLKRNPNFMAISNGVRYLWIISPIDLGGMWQSRQTARQAYWEIPANLYFYANGKGALSNRLHSLAVGAPASPVTRHLAVGEIQFAGNSDPEPGAWPRMAKLAAAQFQTALTVTRVPIARLDATNYQLAEITGTGPFTFTPQQIKTMGIYLRHGGMLMGDAAGGNLEFTNSFQTLCGILFPHTPLEDIPLKSSLYRGNFPGGNNALPVRYRKFLMVREGLQSRPGLLGIRWHGRWVVVYSPVDVTSGLLGTHTWGIEGYAPASAQALARNVILYAWVQHHPAALAEYLRRIAAAVSPSKPTPPRTPATRPVSAKSRPAEIPKASSVELLKLFNLLKSGQN